MSNNYRTWKCLEMHLHLLSSSARVFWIHLLQVTLHIVSQTLFCFDFLPQIEKQKCSFILLHNLFPDRCICIKILLSPNIMMHNFSSLSALLRVFPLPSFCSLSSFFIPLSLWLFTHLCLPIWSLHYIVQITDVLKLAAVEPHGYNSNMMNPLPHLGTINMSLLEDIFKVQMSHLDWIRSSERHWLAVKSTSYKLIFLSL